MVVQVVKDVFLGHTQRKKCGRPFRGTTWAKPPSVGNYVLCCVYVCMYYGYLQDQPVSTKYTLPWQSTCSPLQPFSSSYVQPQKPLQRNAASDLIT